MSNLKKGDIVQFGVFPQKKDYSSKKLKEVNNNIFEDAKGNKYLKEKDSYERKVLIELKPIFWEAIEVNENYTLLFSLQILFNSKYSNSFNTDYKESLVRKCLNEDFVKIAFNEDELGEIVRVNINGEYLNIDENGDYAYIPSITDLKQFGSFRLYKRTNDVVGFFSKKIGYDNSYLTRTSNNFGYISRIALSWSGNGYQIREDPANQTYVGVAVAMLIKNDNPFMKIYSKDEYNDYIKNNW